MDAAGGAMQLPLNTSQQSPDLKEACWNVNQGVGAVYHISPEASRAMRAGRARAKAALAESSGGYSFTLNNLTPGCGLTIDDESMTFTPDPTTPGAGTITINVENSFLRVLSVYVQYLDDHDNVIPVTLENGQPAPGNYLYVGNVSASNAFMGIPMPNDPTVLSFAWMAEQPRSDSSTVGWVWGNGTATCVWRAHSLPVSSTSGFQASSCSPGQHLRAPNGSKRSWRTTRLGRRA